MKSGLAIGSRNVLSGCDGYSTWDVLLNTIPDTFLSTVPLVSRTGTTTYTYRLYIKVFVFIDVIVHTHCKYLYIYTYINIHRYVS